MGGTDAGRSGLQKLSRSKRPRATTPALGAALTVTRQDGTQEAAYFHAANPGPRRLVTADFRTEDGRAKVRALVVDADILIENLQKSRGLAKFGLDYASLAALNSRLIYCSITGFLDRPGPYAHRAGYDYIISGHVGADVHHRAG